MAGALPDVIAGLILAAVAYASTNIDNLLLMTSAASRTEDRRAIVQAFLMSSATVLGLSAAFVLFSGMFSPRALSLLGLIPIFVGVRILLKRSDNQELATLPAIRAWPAGLVLLANSTDTIAVFGPLFAESEPAVLLAMLTGYVLMAGLWITMVLRLSTRFARMETGDKVARWVMPIVMIIIGLYILLDTTTDSVVSMP